MYVCILLRSSGRRPLTTSIVFRTRVYCKPTTICVTTQEQNTTAFVYCLARIMQVKGRDGVLFKVRGAINVAYRLCYEFFTVHWMDVC